MSRIGKKPIAVPSGVTVNVDGQAVSAKGPKGELSAVLVEQVLVQMDDDGITVNPRDKSKQARSMWGMSRTVVSNLIEGVSDGFKKTLEITGVGYRANLQGNDLNLALGYSHRFERFDVRDQGDANCKGRILHYRRREPVPGT